MRGEEKIRMRCGSITPGLRSALRRLLTAEAVARQNPSKTQRALPSKRNRYAVL